MDSELKRSLTEAGDVSTTPPMLENVMNRGRRLRMRRLAIASFAVGTLSVAALALSAIVINQPESSMDSPRKVGEAATATSTVDGDGWTTYHDEKNGFSISYPDDWFRADGQVSPYNYDPAELVTLGTYSAPTNADCEMDRPLASSEANGSLVILLEYGSDPGGEIPPRPESFSEADSVGPANFECFATAGTRLVRFRDNGRYLQVFVVWGEKTDSQTKQQTWEILDSLQFEKS